MLSFANTAHPGQAVEAFFGRRRRSNVHRLHPWITKLVLVISPAALLAFPSCQTSRAFHDRVLFPARLSRLSRLPLVRWCANLDAWTIMRSTHDPSAHPLIHPKDKPKFQVFITCSLLPATCPPQFRCPKLPRLWAHLIAKLPVSKPQPRIHFHPFISLHQPSSHLNSSQTPDCHPCPAPRLFCIIPPLAVAKTCSLRPLSLLPLPSSCLPVTYHYSAPPRLTSRFIPLTPFSNAPCQRLPFLNANNIDTRCTIQFSSTAQLRST
jgi:hypothetical protein